MNHQKEKFCLSEKNCRFKVAKSLQYKKGHNSHNWKLNNQGDYTILLIVTK